MGFNNGKNVVQTEEDLKRLFQKLEQTPPSNNLLWREIKRQEMLRYFCKICTLVILKEKKPVKTKKEMKILGIECHCGRDCKVENFYFSK